MKINWRRVGLTAIVAALVSLLLTGFFWGFVRDAIAVPIYFLIWAGNVLLTSIAQQVFLVLLMLICGIIGINALSKIRIVSVPELSIRKPPISHSRYRHWQMLCTHAQFSRYSRERFTTEARKLILSALANHEGVEVAQAQARVQSGSLPVPETIRKLITQRDTEFTYDTPLISNSAPHRWSRILWKLSGKVEVSPFDSQIAEIADFVVHLMELEDANPTHKVELATLTDEIIQEIGKTIVGKNDVLYQIMCGILSGGHILIEDYPGLAKTLIANSFAAVFGMSFRRIQFTPDLLPGDITGGYVFDRGQGQFVLRQGPIFAHIVLADEINRASPRTQSALLEAMQERQVTIEGETLKLPEPFIVIATQNPIEYEGTFPLPEAQLDRFIIRLSIGYPSPAEEREMVHRRRLRKQDDQPLRVVADAQDLLDMRQQVEDVFVDPDIEQYLVDLIGKTRIHPQVAVGASPRGTLALLKLSRAWAAIHGRAFVLPDDVKLFVKPALIHRLILNPDLWSSVNAAERILANILQAVPVPVVQDNHS